MTDDRTQLFIGSRWTAPSGSNRITVRSASTEELIGLGARGGGGGRRRRGRRGPARPSTTPPAGPPGSRTPGGYPGAARRRVREPLRADQPRDQRPERHADRHRSPAGSRSRRSVPLLRRPHPQAPRGGGPRGPVRAHAPPSAAPRSASSPAIVPWNFPQSLTATKLAPALAAGCTIVVKPSPGDRARRVPARRRCRRPPASRKAWSASCPAAGSSAPTWSRTPASTRSPSPGPPPAAAPSRRPAPRCCGRSPSNSAASPPRSSSTTPTSTSRTSGSRCSGHARQQRPGVLPRHPDPRPAAAATTRSSTPSPHLMSAAPVGDALDESTLIGPLASRNQQTRVAGYIDAGIAEGAKVVVGGTGAPEGLDRGLVRPTRRSSPASTTTPRIAREEIFGPVLTVIGYDDDAEAIRIANDSDYGLGGTVWSSDPDRALAVAGAVHTGTIGINGYLPDPVRALRRGQGQRPRQGVRPRGSGELPERSSPSTSSGAPP